MPRKSAPPRTISQRNRVAVLEAAAQSFATQGFDVALEVIAAKAGVSRMTLYRNFANREELALAIFEHNVAELEVTAQALRGDPEGLFVLLGHFTRKIAQNVGFGDVLNQDPGSGPRMREFSERSVKILLSLAPVAKRAGLLRSDFTGEDVLLLLTTASAVLRVVPTVEERLRRQSRILELLRHGVRGG